MIKKDLAESDGRFAVGRVAPLGQEEHPDGRDPPGDGNGPFDAPDIERARDNEDRAANLLLQSIHQRLHHALAGTAQ